MFFIGCFIGLLAPAVVFLVQKGSQMAAQLLIFLKTQGFAIGIVMVAADDLGYASIFPHRCIQQGIRNRQGIEESFPVHPAIHLIPVSFVTIPHHAHGLPQEAAGGNPVGAVGNDDFRCHCAAAASHLVDIGDGLPEFPVQERLFRLVFIVEEDDKTGAVQSAHGASGTHDMADFAGCCL